MTLITAVITARGGSKGLPGKNVKKINGIPLIAYSIKHCLNSKLIDRTIVSTDCSKILAISKKFGAECPFIRPSNLAQDDSLDLDVFRHYLDWELERYKCSDLIVHIRPTSPLRSKNLIDECIERILDNPEADSLRTVTLADKTPYKMWKIDSKYLKPILKLNNIKEPYNQPRQSLPDVFIQTATVDIFRPRCIYKYNSMNGKKIIPFKIDRTMAIDIDNIDDFKKSSELITNFDS